MLLLTYLIYLSVTDIRDDKLGRPQPIPQEMQFWASAFVMIFLWPFVLAGQARYIPEDRQRLKKNWIVFWVCVGILAPVLLGSLYLGIGLLLGAIKVIAYMYLANKIQRKEAQI